MGAAGLVSMKNDHVRVCVFPAASATVTVALCAPCVRVALYRTVVFVLVPGETATLSTLRTTEAAFTPTLS
jgi:hypothetical protein